MSAPKIHTAPTDPLTVVVTILCIVVAARLVVWISEDGDPSTAIDSHAQPETPAAAPVDAVERLAEPSRSPVSGLEEGPAAPAAPAQDPDLERRCKSFLASLGARDPELTPGALAAYQEIERGMALRALIAEYPRREERRAALGERSVRLADEIDADTRAWIQRQSEDPGRFWSLLEDYETATYLHATADGASAYRASDDPESQWALVAEVNSFASIVEAAATFEAYLEKP